MTSVGKGLSFLQSRYGFELKDVIEDVFHLLKTTKDPKTVEQALTFLATLKDEDKIMQVCGLKSISDVPTSDIADPNEVP